VEVQRSEVRMPDGPFHEVGEFAIGVHLHTEINVEVTVKVVAEE
jgi:large subunit ribosomal protein L9